MEQYMMKNGRPYTYSENSNDDNQLFTDLFNENRHEDIQKVQKWIKEEIRHNNEIYDGTSYGLKHLLERETGVYLTNNQFKDALYLAGYHPENPSHINWSYKLALTRYDDCNNMNPFYIWAKQRYGIIPEIYNEQIDEYLNQNKPEADEAAASLKRQKKISYFLQHISKDKNFPIFADITLIFNYMFHNDIHLDFLRFGNFDSGIKFEFYDDFVLGDSTFCNLWEEYTEFYDMEFTWPEEMVIKYLYDPADNEPINDDDNNKLS